MAEKKVAEKEKGTKIVSCSCKNEYQDKKYGQGRRVANWGPKKMTYGCTVCGRRHP